MINQLDQLLGGCLAAAPLTGGVEVARLGCLRGVDTFQANADVTKDNRIAVYDAQYPCNNGLIARLCFLAIECNQGENEQSRNSQARKLTRY